MKIQGNGFVLREWKLDDVTALHKYANNANVSAFLRDRFPYPYTTDDALFWVNLMHSQQQPITHFAIAINNELCGGIAFEPFTDESRITAELGYWLGQEHWGRGIISQAVKLVTAYAFARFPLLRIEAGVYHKNTASMRVLEKAGYVKEGIMRSAIIKNGEIMDKHMYAILKDDLTV